jgi:hypothetical protein
LYISKAIRYSIIALIFFTAQSAFAQNTKGDKPAKALPRITLKSKPNKSKTVKSGTRDISGRRLRTKNKSSAGRAVVSASSPYKGRRSRGGDRAAKPIGGSPIKIRSSSAQAARNNVYPSKGPYVNNPSKRPRKSERSFVNSAPIGQPVLYSTRSNASPYPKKRRINPRSASRSFASRGKRNVYWGKFSKGEKAYTKDITGRTLRTKNYKTPPLEIIPQRDPYLGRRKSGDKRSGISKLLFNTPSKSNGKAWSGDVSGKPLRKNSTKKRIESAGKFFWPRKLSISGNRGGPGRPMKGSGYQTTGGKGRSNKALAVRIPKGGAGVANYRGSYKQPLSSGGGGFSGGGNGIRPIKGGGSVSGQLRNNRNNPVPVKTPNEGGGIGGYKGNLRRSQSLGFTTQGAGFTGNIKSRRPFKGGGSISGKSRNNGNRSIDPRIPKWPGAARAGNYRGSIKRWDLYPTFTPQGAGYSGGIKSKRPEKGGGSVSGRARDNGRNPVSVRIPSSKAALSGNYSGNIKARRQQKGGGSISGQSRNNNGEPVSVKLPPGFAARAGKYSGNMKARRPEKGGGSISGQPRNNSGDPVSVKLPPRFAARAGKYSGNMKASKPEKGGGSISGQPRNNGGEPVIVKLPPRSALRASKYSGSLKARKPEKGGGSVSGQSLSNNGKPILVKERKLVDYANSRYTGFLKPLKYVKGPNANKLALKQQKPNKTTFLPEGLQVKIKEGSHAHNKLSAKNALDGKRPGKGSIRASEFEGKMKMYWSYKHNPSSAKLAQKTIAPGRAYAKINNYQGNVKMSKPHGSKFHPDAKFAHGHIDNVKRERTLLVNVKLLWSRIFKKNDTQTKAVKEKIRKPRYDKKEKELWKDLYD